MTDRAIATIRLEPEAVYFAEWVGRQRNRQNRELNVAHADGLKNNPIEYDLNGAIGELAVALFFDLPWTNTLDRKTMHTDADVGGLIDVRTVARPGLSLILKKRDKNRPHVLCELKGSGLYGRTAWLHGWLYAPEGKRAEFWREDTGRPNYFVPCRVLRPISALEVIVEDHKRTPEHAGPMPHDPARNARGQQRE